MHKFYYYLSVSCGIKSEIITPWLNFKNFRFRILKFQRIDALMGSEIFSSLEFRLIDIDSKYEFSTN
jgi:hypothetical protein